jgi:hypothetical protein
MTVQGSPHIVFRRAIATENVAAAEINSRMMGRVTLVEALELTALIVPKAPRRRSRYAAPLARTVADPRRPG